MIKKVSAFVLLMLLVIGVHHPVEAASKNQMIVINKKVNQLAFFEEGKLIKVHSVATGREASFTPEGKFKVVNKIKNRPYYSGKIPGGDERNPLGDRWLGINARGTWGTTYAIHGNNNAKTIGTYASAGCVRMKNEDIRKLFDTVAVNTPVVITTSKSSFQAIAEQNGYTVTPAYIAPKTEKFEKTITNLEKTNLYTKPNPTNKLGSTIGSQSIKTYQKSGDFYLVETWLGKRWIYAPKMVEGKIETFNKKVKLNEKASLYDLPTKKNKVVGTLTVQEIEVVKRAGNWYQVKTKNGLKWLYSSKVSVLPKPVVPPKVEQKPEVPVLLPKVTVYNGFVTLFKDGALYKAPSLSEKIVSTVSSQQFTAFEKAGDSWYHVQTPSGPLWLYSERAIEGVVVPIDEFITTTEYEYFYENPRDKNEINGFSIQTVRATAKIGKWYRVVTWMGEGWIHFERGASSKH